MQRKITIVGGNGAMGQLFLQYFKKLGFAAKALDKQDWDNAASLLSNVDLVIICVPIHDTIQIIDQVCKYISKKTILADFTSIKEPIQKHMESVFTGSILSLHPMFGPTISSTHAQVIIDCGGRNLTESQWVIDSLKQLGFTLIKMTPEAHDQAMSFIQGIEHFSTFALGTFLKQHNLHPQELFAIASPIYQTKLALLGRIFDQDASLYADIIMSDDKRIQLIEEYINWLQKWLIKLKEHNHSEFIQAFNDTSKWMGKFTHDSQLSSDHFLNEITHKNS